MNKFISHLFKLKILSALVLILVFTAPEANAAKLYRCNGKVQYRPCGQELHTYKVTYSKSTSSGPRYRYSVKKHTGGNKYVKVIRQSLKKLSKSEGLWRGYLHGNGMAHLFLNIFRGSVKETTRSIGKIPLSTKDGEILFHFRSSLPQGTGWTWRISALAK